ncbi:MAG: histidine kinase, partial [Bacteroidota bacterium]
HKSEKALEALDTLSDMLKYSLYQVKEEVSLAEEMKYVDKFLHLSKIRYSYPLALDIELPEELYDIKIPQFLLLPLVENAIKHGDLKNQDQAFHLRFNLLPNRLVIQAQNKKGKQEKDATGGIGLLNLEKRLKLKYGQEADMQINEDEDFFHLELNIPQP